MPCSIYFAHMNPYDLYSFNLVPRGRYANATLHAQEKYTLSTIEISTKKLEKSRHPPGSDGWANRKPVPLSPNLPNQQHNLDQGCLGCAMAAFPLSQKHHCMFRGIDLPFPASSVASLTYRLCTVYFHAMFSHHSPLRCCRCSRHHCASRLPMNSI